MRRVLVLIVVLVLALSTASGCRRTYRPPVGSEDGKPQFGGTLLYAAEVDLTSLDQQASRTLTHHFYYGKMVFDRLVETSPDGTYQPGLAERWDVSDDGKEWTFYLRRGVVFHDGSPFNAEVVRVNLERIYRDNVRAVARSFDLLEKVEVIDEYTVKFVYSEDKGYGPNLEQLSSGAANMVSIAGLEQGNYQIGTGPFTMAEWIPGQQLRMTANENYWKGRPYLDEIVVIPVPDAQTRVIMLETGEVDVAAMVPLTDVDRLAALPDIYILSRPTTIYHLNLNMTGPPFNDVRVRQAVNYAVDQDRIVETIMFGHGRAPDSPMHSIIGQPYYKSAKTYGYEPAKARQLLADAGYADGFDATITLGSGRYPQAEQIAEAVQAYLTDVGIRVTIEPMEWGAFQASTHLTPDQVSLTTMPFLWWGDPEPDKVFRQWFHSEYWSPRGTNRAYYTNPRVDELIEAAARERDLETRIELYQELQDIIMEDVPVLFLTEFSQDWGVGVNVKGAWAVPDINFQWAWKTGN